MEPHSPLVVAPFGAGRRMCPGKRFVDLALQLILAKVRIRLLTSTLSYFYLYEINYQLIITMTSQLIITPP